MKLSDIIIDLNIEGIIGKTDIEIKGIAYDHRKVKKDYLFVCIEGFTIDGHSFINDAIKNGAIAIIVQKDIESIEDITIIKTSNTRKALALVSAAYFNYPTKKLKVIGITGTNGKTTTTYLIKTILEKRGFKVGLIGTVYNIINDERYEAKGTTPESYELQEMFFKMNECNTDYCIMEVSSHSLELSRVEGILFDEGIFTNLTQDHLDFHKTFDNYFNAKLKLFKQSKNVIINIDDNYGYKIIDEINMDYITYSIDKKSDIYAEDIVIDAKYSSFKLHFKEEDVFIKVPLPGRFNIYNCLAAAAVCINEGMSLEGIKNGLESFTSVPGRSEVIDSKKGFTIVIDYAHTPDGLENILNTIKQYVKGKIITVFGCGGDRDKAKRPIMGEVVGRLSDISIVTSDNPRTENPISIIQHIIPGIKKVTENFIIEEDRKKAIEKAISIASENDVILIAGKGHEKYQIINNSTIKFDENEIINQILNKQ